MTESTGPTGELRLDPDPRNASGIAYTITQDGSVYVVSRGYKNESSSKWETLCEYSSRDAARAGIARIHVGGITAA